jgi:WD40 repeat protein
MKVLVVLSISFLLTMCSQDLLSQQEDYPDYVIWKEPGEVGSNHDAKFFDNGNKILLSWGRGLIRIESMTGLRLDTFDLGNDTTWGNNDGDQIVKMAMIDEHTMVSGHEKAKIKIWDLNTMEILKTIDTLNKFRFPFDGDLNTASSIYYLDVNPELNLILASTQKTILLYDYNIDSILFFDAYYDNWNIKSRYNEVAFLPNKNEFVYSDENQLVFKDITTLEETNRIGLSGWVREIEFSPNGKLMAYYVYKGFEQPNYVEVMDLTTNELVFYKSNTKFNPEIELWDDSLLVTSLSFEPFEIYNINQNIRVADFAQFETYPRGNPILERHPSGDYLLISPTLALLSKDIATGISSPEDIMGNIYPNPTDNTIILNLKLNRPCNLNFNIINNRGKVLKSFDNGFFDIGKHDILLDISFLPRGSYFLTATGREFTQTFKFIKE